MAHPRSIVVYYEHPDWFRPLFAELARRGVPYAQVDSSRHGFDPAVGIERAGDASENGHSLVFNRMSPSAWKRGRGHAILHTLHYLRTLESAGIPVVNGVCAFTVETSKALQVSLIERLGLSAPRTRVVNHPAVLPSAADGLEFPLVVKPNIGGSGAGISRFDTREELENAVGQDLIAPSLDGILLLQEFHPPEDDRIVRVETLEGRTLYGIRVHIGAGAGYNLCPADLCATVKDETPQGAACPVAAGPGAEAFDPPQEIRSAVERIAAAAHLDVGGIEYLESRRDGRRYYYDINALSNFVADPVRVLGFDPTVRLVDALVARASATAPSWRSRGETQARSVRRRPPAHGALAGRQP